MDAAKVVEQLVPLRSLSYRRLSFLLFSSLFFSFFFFLFFIRLIARVRIWFIRENRTRFRITPRFPTKGFLTFDELEQRSLEIRIYFHHGKRLLGKIAQAKAAERPRIRRRGGTDARTGYFACPEIKSKKNWPSARSCYGNKSGQLIMKRTI